MADVKNIALTAEASAAADDLMERFALPEKLDACRLGVAYALREQVEPGTIEADRGGSNFHVNAVDEDGLLRQLLLSYHPEDAEVRAAPYRAMESLMSGGLLLLRDHIAAGEVSALRDIVERGSDAGGD